MRTGPTWTSRRSPNWRVKPSDEAALDNHDQDADGAKQVAGSAGGIGFVQPGRVSWIKSEKVCSHASEGKSIDKEDPDQRADGGAKQRMPNPKEAIENCVKDGGVRLASGLGAHFGRERFAEEQERARQRGDGKQAAGHGNKLQPQVLCRPCRR